MKTLNLTLKEIQTLSQGIANTLSIYLSLPDYERKDLINLYEKLIDLESEYINAESAQIVIK